MENIKIGYIGLGCRGKDLLENIVLAQKEQVVAVCDVYEDRAREGAKVVEAAGQPTPFVSTDYKDIIANEEVNTIIIATAWESHVEIALAAMYAGKAVAMEVGGAYSLEDCYKLVDAYEKTKTPFMFLENCCFGRRELMVLNMVEQGVLGEVVHCAGGYQHDLRDEIAFGKENRHYRLRNYLSRNCENYPTHDLGPIARILNINHGNRMMTLNSVASCSKGLNAYLKERHDRNFDLADYPFAQGDVVTTIVKCAGGQTITLALDTNTPKAYSRGLRVQGTKGTYIEDNQSLFIEGLNSDKEPHWREEWGNMDSFREQYEHPIWKEYLASDITAGHGGIDHLVFEAFFDSVRRQVEPPIDVYDMASWMCISVLSEQSIQMGGAPVAIPDFTNGKWMTR